MKKPIWKIALKLVAGPAAGAFGVWLLAEAPAVHAAMCAGSVL